MPKDSPDWNPDEKVCNHLKHQEIAGHLAKNNGELKQLIRLKLQSMAKRPQLLRGLFFRRCIAELFAKETLHVFRIRNAIRFVNRQVEILPFLLEVLWSQSHFDDSFTLSN